VSSQAVDLLRRAGFRRVELVGDAMLAWRPHHDA